MSGTIIRPTMNMVSDILCRVHEKETWILNDCAIIRTKDGRFAALIAKRMDDGDIYYGIIAGLHPCANLHDTLQKLDIACENYEALPTDVFREKVDWAHIDEGHRYL